MSEAPSGSMLAVMGLEISVIDKICNNISNEGNIFVAPANINTPNQIVIGGDHKAIDIASIKLKEEEEKRLACFCSAASLKDVETRNDSTDSSEYESDRPISKPRVEIDMETRNTEPTIDDQSETRNK